MRKEEKQRYEERELQRVGVGAPKRGTDQISIIAVKCLLCHEGFLTAPFFFVILIWSSFLFHWVIILVGGLVQHLISRDGTTKVDGSD
jgi:hypothetical protein